MSAAPSPPRGEAALLAFALLFPTLGIWLYFVAAATPAWSRALYLVCKIVQFALPAVWVVAVERSPPRLPLGQSSGWRGLAFGLLGGLLAAGGLLLAWYTLLAGSPLLAGLPAGIAGRLAAIGIASPGAFALVAVFYAVFHSGLEELYWRWFVYGGLRRRLSPAAAVVLASLGFMAHHVVLIGLLLGSFGPLTWLCSLAVAVAGAAWAWLYEKTGSLAGPWLSHGLIDAALMAIGWMLLPG